MNIGLVFGGSSVEHEISVITALQAYHSYHGNKYNLIPIYLTKDKKFYTGKYLTELNRYKDLKALLKKSKQVTFHKDKNNTYLKVGTKKVIIDAIWPVVHGNNCEDGSLYNYFNGLSFNMIK